MDAEALSTRLAAIASPQRMRIIATLAGQRLHVSELARRVEMSRALLYMHLSKLEEAGFVSGELELGADGKALKFFEVVPFSVTLDADAIVAAVDHPDRTRSGHPHPAQRAPMSGTGAEPPTPQKDST